MAAEPEREREEPAATRVHEKAGTGPMAMCPMAETCKGMMDKPLPRFLLILPGIMFIAVGILILFLPMLLVWMVAAASIVMGMMMLVGANFMRRMSERLRSAHQEGRRTYRTRS